MTRVLIADDDDDIRELVTFKLAQKGYQVTSTADGPAALAAVEAEPPDLAVLDVTMPGMSGLDVCRHLRANPDTAGIAVILLTARAQEADVQAGFGSGADDYVVKPFSPRELLSRIEALLARMRR
jgi:DNA-binding response OmpR family regulator